MLGHSAVASGGDARGDQRTTGPVIITPTEPQPQYHATMAMPVHGMPKGWSARVLFLLRADGTVAAYAPLVDYMRDHPGHGGAWQDNVARGLGLLWDFTRSRGQENLSGAEEEGRDFLHLHLRAFALALLNGTIRDDDGDDPSGLFWPRTGLGRARILLGAIERFAAWQAAERKAAAGQPPDPDGRENRLGFTEMLVWSRVAKVSMLKHVSKPKAVRVPRAVDVGSFGSFETETVKFFPPEHAERLLFEGHVRPGREHEPDEFLRFNLRDQMMALLDGWGGLRRSEGLHLWVQDVAEDRDDRGHAIVVLHHPAEARVWGWDASEGRMGWRTRQEVLDRDYHGLRPRHLHMRGGYHAGWKGMALNADLREFVYWRDPVAGLLFWNMYVAYVLHVRPALMARRIAAGGRDHPFLFVSEGRGERTGDPMVGSPYSPAAYERNHEAAVRRIGLPYAKAAGTTTHGLRHLYGQSLAQRRLSAAMIRKCMRHLSFLSQVPYVAPSRSDVNATLNAAIEGRPGSRLLELEPGGSESSQALYRLNEIIKGRMPA